MCEEKRVCVRVFVCLRKCVSASANVYECVCMYVCVCDFVKLLTNMKRKWMSVCYSFWRPVGGGVGGGHIN